LLVSELVTNAYKAMQADPICGIACIEVSLRLFDDNLLIEVIDSSPQIPVPNPGNDAEAENWRGLTVVERLSQEWGYFWSTGRKVVYCTLPVTAPHIHDAEPVSQ
jgi:anti-sigma regulatory factor (Ser/Thr protein kinase)